MKTKLIFILFIVILSSCSVKTQARWDNDVKAGELPNDIMLNNDMPMIITVSTESDGDILISYISTDGTLKIQMYGCSPFDLTCGTVTELGTYTFTFPQDELQKTERKYEYE